MAKVNRSFTSRLFECSLNGKKENYMITPYHEGAPQYELVFEAKTSSTIGYEKNEASASGTISYFENNVNFKYNK